MSQQPKKGIARMITEGDLTWSGGKPKGSRYRITGVGQSMSRMMIEDHG